MHYLTEARAKKSGDAIRASTKYEVGRMLGFKFSDGEWTPTGKGVARHWSKRQIGSITRQDVRALVRHHAKTAPTAPTAC